MSYIPYTSKKGFVLSIVLWIVVVILLGSTTLAIFSKDTVELSKGLKDKLKATFKAEDVLESLKYYITTADYDNISLKNSKLKKIPYFIPNTLVLDNRWYSLTKEVKIRLQDTSALVNIMTGIPKKVAALATKNSQNQLKYIITDSLKDWKDKDDFVSLNGAESSTYEFKKNVKYTIRNSGAIQSRQELRLINGIDSLSKIEWKRLKQRLYYGQSGYENLALIDAKYLAYALKISQSYAKTLIDIRKEDLQKYIKIVSNLKIFNDDFMGFYIAKQIKIEINVNINNAKSIIKTTILFREKQNKQYTCIRYESW